MRDRGGLDLPRDLVPLVVLDTNVLFDWMVFGNPGVRPLVDAIVDGRLIWAATPSMRHEFNVVLARGFGAWPIDAPAAAALWQGCCRLLDGNDEPRPATHPRCRDTGDQMFVDLSLRAGARWLVSRDRALLALRKPMLARGVEVLVPERWRPPTDEASRDGERPR